MISIITCNRNQNSIAKVRTNITDTIGAPFEIISIDNSQNEYSIFSAYNEGIKRAKGDILCFMHDDIVIHTQNWGKLVEKHLLDENVGLIGTYGGHMMSKYPLGYWDHPCSGILIQGKTISGNYYTEEWNRCPIEYNLDSIEAVTLDGFWICGKRSLFNTITYDEDTFKGFHCYDLDICFQAIKAGKTIKVVFDILIEHKSFGTVTEVFYDQLKLWYKKWESFLPLCRGLEGDIQMPNIEDLYIKQNIAYRKICQEFDELRLSKRMLLINKLTKMVRRIKP